MPHAVHINRASMCKKEGMTEDEKILTYWFGGAFKRKYKAYNDCRSQTKTGGFRKGGYLSNYDV